MELVYKWASHSESNGGENMNPEHRHTKSLSLVLVFSASVKKHNDQWKKKKKHWKNIQTKKQDIWNSFEEYWNGKYSPS